MPTVGNGTTDPASGTVDYNESYSITCDTGYNASEPDEATCGADGSFDSVPECTSELIQLHLRVSLPRYIHTN